MKLPAGGLHAKMKQGSTNPLLSVNAIACEKNEDEALKKKIK
jgi:hypothetical protein